MTPDEPPTRAEVDELHRRVVRCEIMVARTVAEGIKLEAVKSRTRANPDPWEPPPEWG